MHGDNYNKYFYFCKCSALFVDNVAQWKETWLWTRFQIQPFFAFSICVTLGKTLKKGFVCFLSYKIWIRVLHKRIQENIWKYTNIK